MKERPILFSAPMVRAILDGRKTQTLRSVNFNDRLGRWDESGFHQVQDGTIAKVPWSETEILRNIKCPYGQPGDRRWVKETWASPHSEDGRKPNAIVDRSRIHYAATEERGGLLWRQSMFMPRWASRITLEIVSVRVEKLQDISEADAIAEGVREYGMLEKIQAGMDMWARHAYKILFESINGSGSWDFNPWVWVIEFKVVESQ